MRILYIVNNLNQITDGVGVFGQNVFDEMKKRTCVDDITIIDGYTEGMSIVQKIISLRMSKALLAAKKILKREQYDYVMIEYPFKEYNPFLLLFLDLLQLEMKKQNTKFILSLHEYFRAKPLRQKFMRALVQRANILFVTENKILEYFRPYKEYVYIRDIPSNIIIHRDDDSIKEICKDRYVYFGLVLDNKAFDEMLDAWRIFNDSKNYRLEIITGSAIHIDDADEYNISICIGLSAEEVAEKIKDALFFIVPVKPEVGMYNSTFKTACCTGGISLGHFCAELREKDFCVDIDDYSLDNFCKGLQKLQNIDDDSIHKMSEKAYENSYEYTYKHTVDQILEGLNDYENRSCNT